MQLSVCVIAKNEEDRLPRAIASVADLADEIVVTDTGSTDRTVARATEFGARISTFPWVEDFSAAYNHCISQAGGEWILQLDADEELIPTSHEAVRSCIANEKALAYTVERRDLYDADSPDAYTKMLHVRLFRNRPDLRFIGRIHHQFVTPLSEIAERDGLEVLPSQIELLHHGYAGGDQQAKLARAARLMELELQDRPDQFYYLVELGRTWIRMGDERGVDLLTMAAAIVKNDLPRALESGGILAALLEHVLACDKLPAGFPLTWAEARRLAEQCFPNAVPILWQLALREFKRNRFAACAELLERIVELRRTQTYDKLYSFKPSILQGDAMLNLGVCYARMGKLGAARRCFRSLEGSPKYVGVARENIGALSAVFHSV